MPASRPDLAVCLPVIADTSDLPNTPNTPRLYSDETVYTLRFPATGSSNGNDESSTSLDLDNTARAVYVRKRNGLPRWDAPDPWVKEQPWQ